MRIIIAGDYPYNKNEIRGGISNVNYNLVEGYKKRKDVDVVVLALTTGKEKSITIGPNVKVIFKKIPRIPQTINSFLFESFVVKNEIKKLKPNIVHSHNMTGYTIGAIKSGFPCLITPHGDWISEQLKNSQKKSIKTYLKVYIWKKIYKYIFNRGKAFSAISPYIEDLIKSYNPAANIFKINNPLSNDYYKKINRIRKKNRILWAGRICKLKRLDIAIEVFKSLREVYPYLIFEVAGQPDTKTEKEFNQLKKDAINSLGKKIVFHGQLSREDMIKCYDRSKIFLLTSEQEASPMVIAEAMVRGCVPVSFDLPGIRHLINDGVNGVMIKNRKPDLLKLKIIDMLNKPSLLNNMSINGINASYSYSSNKIIEQYISVFKQIG